MEKDPWAINCSQNGLVNIVYGDYFCNNRSWHLAAHILTTVYKHTIASLCAGAGKLTYYVLVFSFDIFLPVTWYT